MSIYDLIYWFAISIVPAIIVLILLLTLKDYAKAVYDKTAGKEVYDFDGGSWDNGDCDLCKAKNLPIKKIGFNMIKYIDNNNDLHNSITTFTSLVAASIISVAAGVGGGGFMLSEDAQEGIVYYIDFNICSKCCELKKNRNGNKIAIAPYEFCKHDYYNKLRKEGFEFIAITKLTYLRNN